MRLILAASFALAIGMFAPAAHAALVASRIVGWAEVDGSGTLVKGKNVTGATHPRLATTQLRFQAVSSTAQFR